MKQRNHFHSINSI